MTSNPGFEKIPSASESGSSDPRAELEEKLNAVAQKAVHAVVGAIGTVAGLARDHGDTLHNGVDKAGAAFDRRTNGRYAHKVTKATSAAHSGVNKAADLGGGAKP